MGTPLRISTINARGLNGDPYKLVRSAEVHKVVLGDVVVVTETKIPAPNDIDSEPLVYSRPSTFTLFSSAMSKLKYSTYHSAFEPSALGGCAILIRTDQATILDNHSSKNCVVVHAVIRELEFIVIGVYVHPTLREFCEDTATIHFINSKIQGARSGHVRVFLAGDFNCVTDGTDRNSGSMDEPPPLAQMRAGLLDAWIFAAIRESELGATHGGADRGATFVKDQSWSRIDRIFSDAAPLKAVVWRMLDNEFDHRALCVEYAAQGDLPPKPKCTDRALASNPAFYSRASAAVKQVIAVGGTLKRLTRDLRRAATAITSNTSVILELEKQAYREPNPLRKAELLKTARGKRVERNRLAKKRRLVLDTRHGERFTKHFFDRSRSRDASPFPGLLDGNNALQVEPIKALRVAHCFYSELYDFSPPLDRIRAQAFIDAGRAPSLSAEQRSSLEAPLLAGDFFDAIRGLRNGRAVGDDGIPSEILRCIARPLSVLCAKVWPSFLREGMLPDHLRGSIIILLKKKGKDPRLIGNLRPVALLNSLYKVFAKAIAVRLGPVLEEWIHPFQTGFVPKRRITHNTLELQSIYDYATGLAQPAPLALALLDIRKAFDSVSHDWLDLVMESAGFPAYFRRAVRTVTSGGCARVRINGYLSDPLPIRRGVRQGCPLSPMLFAVAMDPVLRRLNSLDNVSSLPLPGCADGRYRPWAACIPSGARMYADDTALVAFSECDLKRMIDIMHEASPLTGLYVNSDKSVVVSTSEDWRASFNEAEWTSSANYLGLDVGARSADPALIWDSAVRRSNNLKARWKGAHVGLRGRAALYNAYVGPHILQLANIHPLPTTALAKLLIQLREFMWSDSQRLMRADLLELPLRKGGLGVQTPEEIVYARRLQQLRELPAALEAGWAWANLWSLELTRLAPYAQALHDPKSVERNSPAYSVATESLSAIARAGASRVDPSDAERSLTPMWLCSRSKKDAPLLWSLSGDEACAAEKATRYGVEPVWPPWLPEEGERIAVWNAEESGYDTLSTNDTRIRPHGHLQKILAQRVLPNGELDPQIRSLEAPTAFTIMDSQNQPSALLVALASTLPRIRARDNSLLHEAESRDYKSAYRLVKGQRVEPYHRGGFTRKSMMRLLRLAWQKVSPRAAAFVWKVLTGRVRPLERLARYAIHQGQPDEASTRFKDGECQSCLDGTQEDMKHILSACPCSQPIRARATELFLNKYGYAPRSRQFYPLAASHSLDRRWAIWASQVWHILWKGRCEVYISSLKEDDSIIPFPTNQSLALLEEAWATYATLRDKEDAEAARARVVQPPRIIS